MPRPQHRFAPPSAPSVATPASSRSGQRKGDVVRGPLAAGRETVESVVIAFTLALLFRAFEAEAFVIPTGSMAPTLMGRHKDLACEACGRDFRVGCSAEEDDQSQSLRAQIAERERELADGNGGAALQRDQAQRRIDQLRMQLANKMVPEARCPNCGHVTRVVQGSGAAMRYDPRYPSFSGDRILVNKFVYDVLDPQRWDVVVFKYPEEAKTNYIKRLVGLPGETVSIVGGDVWTSRDGGPSRIARKPPDRLLAMLQCVHDSRYVSAELERAGWPRCWADWSVPGQGGGWKTDDDGRSFSAAVAAGSPATLRYRHFLPTVDDWEAVARGESLAAMARPTLIDDFQPYNAIATRRHWVGDLAVEFVCQRRVGDGGRLVIDLVEAGVPHRCEIDLGTGDAVITPAGGREGSVSARARTQVRGRGSWRILFANVDDELSLFVDGRRTTFDRPTAWTRAIAEVPLGEPTRVEPQPGSQQPSDLSPVGITVDGADLVVKNLRVLRDVYYTGAIDVGVERERLDFELLADQFFVLGDNSTASKDSRLWQEGHHVDRELLIGKAMAIFWPHAVPASWSVPVKIGGVELRLPSWPNFGRMGFVR